MTIMKTMYEYGIGNTPMTTINLCNGNKLYIKQEKYNFLNSIKARTAYYLIKGLDFKNIKGVVESTSGNLGFALSYFLEEIGVQFLCLIDESISKEKLEKIKQHHIDYRIVSKIGDLDYRSSRIKVAKELHESGRYYWCNQYDNKNCMLAHYETTGPEIWRQCRGEIDICLCPVGTGGTITGIAKYLKEKNKDIKVIGVEPIGSTIFGGVDGEYINAGTGLRGPSGLVERYMDYIDGYYQISDKESISCCKRLKKDYGLELGISSAMTYAAALDLSIKEKDKNIVMVAPDGMDSYISVLEDKKYIREGLMDNEKCVFEQLRYGNKEEKKRLLG